MLVEQMILRSSTAIVEESHRLSLSSYSMLCMGGRSLAGGCCAGRKTSSAVCCGGVLVLVSPGLDPADSPAVAAPEALSRTPDVTLRHDLCAVLGSGISPRHVFGRRVGQTQPMSALRHVVKRIAATYSPESCA